MGRKTSLALNLNEMPALQAGTLKRLLEESNFLTLDEVPISTTTESRDDYHHRITVETETIQHTVRVTDASMPGTLRPLVDELARLARLQGTK